MEKEAVIFDFKEVAGDNLRIAFQECEGIGHAIIVSLNGYIDTYTSLFFRAQIEKVLNAGYINLIFDCSHLSYVSSAGIGVFSAMLKQIKLRNGDIVLVQIPSKVMEVFNLLGFSQLFNFKDSLGAAESFFKQEDSRDSSVFPKVFSCPVCSKRLKTSGLGRFRCSECKSILAVDEKGQVTVG